MPDGILNGGIKISDHFDSPPDNAHSHNNYECIFSLTENGNLVSQKLEQYFFSGFIVSVLICFEYLGYDYLQLQNIKILNIYMYISAHIDYYHALHKKQSH